MIASDDASCLKSGAHRFVQGVRVLFQKPVIDGFRRCASEASQYAARFGDGPQVTGESTAHVVGLVVGATLRQQQFGLVPEVIVPMFWGHVYFTLLLVISISYDEDVELRNQRSLIVAYVPTSVQYFSSRCRSALVIVLMYPDLPRNFMVSSMLPL